MSSFLLNRTKDMVNKYRQLLVREAQVRTAPPRRVCVDLIPSTHARGYLWLPAGEPVSRDGDAGAPLPPGRALRFGGGQTAPA